MNGTGSTMSQVWKAVRQLDPGKVMKEASTSFTFVVLGANAEEVARLREWLLGTSLSVQDTAMAGTVLRLYAQPVDDAVRGMVRNADFVLAGFEVDPDLIKLNPNTFLFDAEHPLTTVRAILGSEAGHRLRLSLARHLPALRTEVARRIIREVSQENAVFVIGTALGNVVPNVLQPVLGIAEAAGDTAFLTANQVRMLFTITSAFGQRAGYMALWREVGSIAGAAFGWRALARNLISKIPLGGGLLPKGAVAYAGTFVVGEGIVFYLTTGRKWTRPEAAEAFRIRYAQAVETVRTLIDGIRERGRLGRPGR